MICGKCGKQNEEGNIYCTWCNSPLEGPGVTGESDSMDKYESDYGFADPDSKYIEPLLMNEREHSEAADPQKEQTFHTKGSAAGHRKKKQNRIMIALAAVAIAMALVLPGISLPERSPQYYFPAKNALTIFYNDNSNMTDVLNSQGKLLNSTSQPYSILQSMDCSAILRMENNSDYYISSEKTIALEDPVDRAILSDNGKFIIYTTRDDVDTQCLYLYDVKKEKKKLIAKAFDEDYNLFTVLPDGKTITYTTYTNSMPRKLEAFICKKGKKPESLGENTMILAVSYNLDYMFFCRLNQENQYSLYVRHNGKDQKLTDHLAGNKLLFNRDYSEVMFSDNDSTYVSTNGGQMIKVADALIDSIVLPEQCINQQMHFFGYYYGIDSFRDKVAVFQDGSIRYINKKYRVERLGNYFKGSSSYPVISEDGNSLIYRSPGDGISKVDNLKEATRITTAISDADAAVVTRDFSRLYYTKGQELYCIDYAENPRLLEKAVSYICMNVSGDTLFLVKYGTGWKQSLYYTKDGRTISQVPGTDGIEHISNVNGCVGYREITADGNVNTYINTRGTEFVLLQEEKIADQEETD